MAENGKYRQLHSQVALLPVEIQVVKQGKSKNFPLNI